MNTMPLVSIVIPVYNGSNFLRDAIESALKQTYDNIEILIVNDGSQDNGQTREIALSYGKRIRYFEKENGGVSSALNYGIREMHGEYFAWLSHDDWLSDDAIECEVEALLAAGGGNSVVFGDFDFLRWPSHEVAFRRPALRYGRELIESRWFAVHFGLIYGCSLLVPRSFFLEHGGFNEKLRAIQDSLKFLEIFRECKPIYVDKVLSYGRWHKTQTSHTYAKVFEENDWFYSMLIENLDEKELSRHGMSIQSFCGAYAEQGWWVADPLNFPKTRHLLHDKLLQLPQPEDADQRRAKLANKMRSAGSGKVYIYCAGKFGRMLLASLRRRGFEVDGIIDRCPEPWISVVYGIRFLYLDEIDKEDLLIVGKEDPRNIQKELRAKGFHHVWAYYDLDLDFLQTPVTEHHMRQWLY